MRLQTFAVLLVGGMVCAQAFGQGKNNPQNAQSEMAFAFIGDMPYTPANEPKFENLVDEINADPSIQFVMHAGDIKSGSEECSDQLITHRFMLYQEFNVPFIYTPGDNEWTDCHRLNNGPFPPLDRLAFVRSLFFAYPDWSTGGNPIQVNSETHQAGFEPFVENVWFKRNDVIFATIHVVGSNNDLKPWTGKNDDTNQYGDVAGTGVLGTNHINEYVTRCEANLAWLDTIFEAAQDANGIFLVLQASPHFSDFNPNAPSMNCNSSVDPTPSTDGFHDFLLKLKTLTEAYGKPVVFANGDDHVLKIDNPFDEESPDKYNPPVMNFTQVQTYGQDNIDWIKVYVDPKSENVFRYEPHIVQANLP